MKPSQIVIGIAGLGLGVFGVLSLREATLSTHGRVDPDSRIELVLHAETHRPEPRQTLPEMVEALLLSCRLEVSSDLVGPIVAEGDGRFRAVLKPELDATNRKQLTGCLEDWTIDSFRAEVVQFRTVS
jgi:hypothetical protein